MKVLFLVLVNAIVFNLFSQNNSVSSFKKIEEVNGKIAGTIPRTSFMKLEKGGFIKMDINFISYTSSVKRYTLKKFDDELNEINEIIFEVPSEMENINIYFENSQLEFLFYKNDQVEYVSIDLEGGLVAKKSTTLPFLITIKDLNTTFINRSSILFFVEKSGSQKVVSINKADGMAREIDFFKNNHYDETNYLVFNDFENEVGYMFVENKDDSYSHKKIIRFNENGVIDELFEIKETDKLFIQSINVDQHSDGSFYIYGTYADNRSERFDTSTGVFLAKNANNKQTDLKFFEFEKLENYSKFFYRDKVKNQVKKGLSLFSFNDKVYLTGEAFFKIPNTASNFTTFSFTLILDDKWDLISEKFIDINASDEAFYSSYYSQDILVRENDLVFASVNGYNTVKLNVIENGYDYPERAIKLEKETTEGAYLTNYRGKIVSHNEDYIILCQIDISKKKVDGKRKFVTTHYFYKVKI